LREYRDGGEAYEGQIGSESTPAEYLAHLWEVTRECVRVLKPSGSMFWNIGDKFAGGGMGGHGGPSSSFTGSGQYAGQMRTQYGRAQAGVPDKSLIALPWRFAIGCIDQLGLILRRDVVWHKANPLPESVSDRCPTSHEYLFHMTKEPRYYAATDEIREPHGEPWRISGKPEGGGNRRGGKANNGFGLEGQRDRLYNPLGKLPSSVWSIPSEPLVVPPELGVDHYAAFPTELPRRCILGWSPPGICTECGEGRRPVHIARRERNGTPVAGTLYGPAGKFATATGRRHEERTVRMPVGYSCACPEPSAPTRPAVVLDPFSGTGTTPLVADVLGRDGIGVDASHDYCRLARWRAADPGQRARAMRVPPPPQQLPGQAELFAAGGGA
jgi:DNA modification methylase